MPNFQKAKEAFWTDESGQKMPSKRLLPSEKLMERNAETIYKDSVKIHNALMNFKANMKQLCDQVYEAFMAEKDNTKAGKGNFTWFNFDRSIKIEVSVNERIEFDDLTIKASKDKLDEFLNANLDAKQEFLKEMVTAAFSSTKGKLDTKKVMSLLKYKSRIPDPLFQDAMNLLEQSIRRPSSKVYFRIWERDEQGEYKNIDLNFSSVGS